jgi:hypothetical protein
MKEVQQGSSGGTAAISADYSLLKNLASDSE